jgi:hypothetical protein
LLFRYSNSIEGISVQTSSDATSHEARPEFAFADDQTWVTTQGNGWRFQVTRLLSGVLINVYSD